MSQEGTQGALIPAEGPADQLVLAQPGVAAGSGFLAANTKRAYFRDWMDFFLVDSLDKITMEAVLSVQPEFVADFRDQCLADGLSPGTVNRKLSSIRAFFDQMILRGLVKLNPAHPKLVRTPKRGNVQKMDYLSLQEVRSFLGAIDRNTPLGRRDYALIMTDIHMGLRRSEVVAIRAEGFKISSGAAYLTFLSKGEKERLITVNDDLAEALTAYAADRGSEPGWLFPGNKGQALSGDQFWRIVQKYLEKAGIKKKVGTHGLRATFITTNIEKGTPLSEIQKSVGHSRGDTTLGYARDLEMIKSRAPKAMEGFKADSSHTSSPASPPSEQP